MGRSAACTVGLAETTAKSFGDASNWESICEVHDAVRAYNGADPVVNINWLAVHYANERGDPSVTGQTIADRDQNSGDKTWLTCHEAAVAWDAARRIYDATCPGWRSHDAMALSLVS